MRSIKNIGLIFLLFATPVLTAQNNLDSLLNEAHNGIGENKAKALNELAQKYYSSNPDTSLILAREAIKESKKINYIEGEGDALYWQSKAHYKKLDYREAITLSFESIKIRETIDDTIGLAKAYSNAGLCYFSLNKYDSALYCQNKCLEQYLKTDEKKSTAIAYNNIGSAQINLGNYKDAIIAFTKSMEIFQEIDYPAGVASGMLNIGQIYDRMGSANDTIQNNKALDYYYQALDIYLKLNDLFKIGETYNAIGIELDQKAAIYSELLKTLSDSSDWQKTNIKKDSYYTQAIQYLLKASEIYNRIDFPLGEAQVINNIGTIYMNRGQFSTALSYLNKALNKNTELNNREEIATNFISIAKCYRIMGKYQKALESMDQGWKIAEEIRTPLLFQSFYAEYYEIYKKLNNYNKALWYHEQFTSVKDSLLRADNLTTINEVQALYENQIQEKQLELSEAKVREQTAVAKKRQQQIYGFAGLVVLLLVLAGVILRSLQQKRKSNKELSEKNALITNQQKEITDSIKYASRIQTAVLPQMDFIEDLFKDDFILFKPQHIVSGDFFWIRKLLQLPIVPGMEYRELL